jgi:superfamily I DNA/RNA helicase
MSHAKMTGNRYRRITNEYTDDEMRACSKCSTSLERWIAYSVHAAKGREFETVFLPATEQEIIPGMAKSRDVEEERRLFYVGITRAREEVLISYCRERKPPFGSIKPVLANASQFITEASVGIQIAKQKGGAK